MQMASILWRRLDTPGHDACRLTRNDRGWEFDGAAVYRENGNTAWLAYCLVCDLAWRTARGMVRGWLGNQPVTFSVERTSGGLWTLNGAAVPGLERCVDLDLGFTPATNASQFLRIGLSVSQAEDVPVAWLDVSTGAIGLLPQRYERRSPETYWYEAAGYQGFLEVDSTGFIRRYPGLWEAEA